MQKNKLGISFFIRTWFDSVKEIQEAFNKFGDHFCVKVPFFKPMFVSRSADVAAHLFKNDDVMYSRQESNSFKGIYMVAEDGLLTSEGETWEKIRTLLQPAFLSKQMNFYIESILGILDNTKSEIDNIAKNIDEQPFDIDLFSKKITLEVIGKTVVGTTDYKTLEDIESYTIKSVIYGTTWSMYALGALKLVFWPSLILYSSYKKKLYGYCLKLVKTKSSEVQGSFDMISTLKSLKDENGKNLMTDHEISSQLLTMVVAGYKTTAALMNALFYVLSQRPDIVSKIRQEISEKLPKESLSMSDISKFTYVDAVVKEILRLYPPIPATGRKAKVPITIKDLSVPQGSMLFVSLYALHRNSNYWENPGEFIPERHFPKAGKVPNSFMPFGIGKRSCVGLGLAMLEAKLAIISIIPDYDFKLKENQSFRVKQNFTLDFEPKVELFVERRA